MTAVLAAPVPVLAQTGAPDQPPSPPAQPQDEGPPFPLTLRGRNQIGVTWLMLFDTGPRLEAAGEDAVKVGGGLQWGAASHGVEVFYARRLPFVPDLSVTLELPVAYVPRVRQAAGSEIFDETGDSLGPAPDFEVIYFTPRINFAFPVFGALDFMVALGAGVARFSEVRNGEPYEATGYPFYYSLGAAFNLDAHWAIRATGGGYGHGVEIQRSLLMINASLVSVF